MSEQVSQVVFILGHPAAGKTSLYQEIEQKLIRNGQTSFRINDREFFWRAMELDADRQYHQFYEDGSHRITDPRFFDLQFRLLRESLIETEWIEDWVFVELTSKDYARTMQQIGLDVLADSILIWVHTSLETALARNRNRSETGKIDDTAIPDHYIHDCFDQLSDLTNLSQNFRCSFQVTNDQDDESEIERLAGEIVRFLLQVEV